MIKAILNGCNGQMGRVISDLAATDESIEIVAGVDIDTAQHYDYPVYGNIADCDVPADVIIDFSHVSCIDALMDYSVERQIPVIVCTTGLSETQEEKVRAASGQVAVLKSANMSLGINTLMEILKPAAKALAAAGFDVEIVEKHHNRKLDAPSGTAIALADSVNEAMDGAYSYTLDRSDRRQKRDPREIGIQSVRGGSIVGEHEVMFCGMDEVVTLKHTAYSRSIFANGAIEAARYLAGKPAGYYTMADVVKA
ncbi:MAG: 4-hydroxy-tetrahydrodipicolinate reductase [Clostridiales bacterium]|nr:4-hydroxy-tetrahydrodipicolinate reductase [Clostridiales bacterium]